MKPKRPEVGDFVFVPEPERGNWIRGVVNALVGNDGGQMLVSVVTETRTYLVRVNEREYLETWAWPADVVAVTAKLN